MWHDTLPAILLVCGPAALVVAVYTGLRIFMSLSRIREESRKSLETTRRIERDYEERRARETEERQRLIERFDQIEVDLRERVEQSEKVATGTRERLIKLEQYLKEFFEIELKSVFESFDKTVASILEEMKAELLRGVDRIEEIQAVVDSKSLAQERILEGEGSVYRMIADTSATESPDPVDAADSVSVDPFGRQTESSDTPDHPDGDRADLPTEPKA